ncbi:hypothetical protein RRG08_032761 [Elysia crispata]|uniref:Phospholipid-transporting ATPase n=1 Tax=Elysia crispata TaxID=231223 RepID=A0AAE0YNE8_9GAST|nr:hypothetical protein RRG08_032761 [Elysia crispata]
MACKYIHLDGGSVQEMAASLSNSFADIPSLSFIQKLFSRRRPPPNRRVYVDNKLLPGEDTLELYNYPDNTVISSKYTLLTFLPKNLFEQFRRIANFYFLCVALTQFMIDTPVTPITSVLPLLFVISITAIKQGYEDYLRHNADKEVNLRPTVIIRNGQVQRGLRAMDVKVGDIVKTNVNEEFPCDMILLSSEDPKGHCFITTANLDGETNLKTHYSQYETRNLRSPSALGTLRASITCKPQTADLYTFQGVMHFGHDADPQPLGPEHLLLRGARLKNTSWVYGCAIYTGKETKMALNSTAKKAKFSRVERKLNTFLILFLVILVLSCVVPTLFKYWFEDKEGKDPWYFRDEDEGDDDDASGILETGLAFMVLVNYIIPISLYVTIEMQKFFGSLFFNYDVEMYDVDLKEPALANTSDLNEELGQVEYLFTDKTGTLTENTMTFRKCIIGKRCFEEINGMLCERTESGIIPVTDPSYQVSGEDPSYQVSGEDPSYQVSGEDPSYQVSGEDPSYQVSGEDPSYQVSGEDPSYQDAYKFRLRKKFSVYQNLRHQDPPLEMTDFLRVLVLCHTVRVDRQYGNKGKHEDVSENANTNANFPFTWKRNRRKDHSNKDSLDSYFDYAEETQATRRRKEPASHADESEYSCTGHDYEYQASSPDEKAFVEACCKYGTIYHGLVDDMHEVSYRQEMHRFKLLETLPFDAVRKRMSVIIRDAEGDIFLLCKGAEIAIFDRVVEGDIEITQKSIDEYAMCGYRTLCLARRKLDEFEYQELSEKLAEARLSLVDREAKVAEVYNECESNLTLLGATAVEDKLQADVPETITALREAGIKVWVLTGDKEETAVNISHSAGHFRADMEELRLTQVASSDQCHEQLIHLLKVVKGNGEEAAREFSLVIDGKSLAYALRKHKSWLRELCSYCVAVLCCRMSPIQKAEVVNLIKTSPQQPVTAAIGDGANDVSMIQEADVGFGIMGKEGRQAVCNSDFAFGKFRFLRRALLLHGHFYYHRLAILVKYFFYKNVAWVTCQIYFAIYSYWSQQSLYDPFYLTFYNMTSTSLPILIYGIFEQCKPIHRLVGQPHLYKSISRNASLRWSVFLEWMVLALWHSLVFFFSMYFMEDDNTTLFSSGYSIGVYDFGTVIAYAGIISVNMKLMLETYYWCWPMVFAYLFTCAGTILMAVIYTNVFWPSWVTTTRDLYGVPGQLYHSPAVWLCLLITIIGALLPDFVLRTFRDNKDVLEDPKMHKVVSEMSWSEVSLSTHSATSLPKKTLEPRQSERHENLTPSWVPSPSTPSGCNTPRRHILHTKATLVVTSPISSMILFTAHFLSFLPSAGICYTKSHSEALGKAEMILRSQETELANGDSDIELHDVKHHFNYGTVGHTGRYDNGKLSGSGTREDLARVPAAVTVKSGQKQDYHQFHDLTEYQSYHQNLPDGNNSLLGGSALGEIQNYSKTNGATRKRTTDSKELYPSHSRKLDDSSLSVSNSSSKAKDFSQPLQHLIDSSQTKESNPVQNSQLPLSPPGPSSNSSSPIPQLSAPIFTRRQSQSPPVGSSLLASAQTHEQENEGHDNPAFSFASEQTECPPEQLSTEGDKHVSLIDVVVRL